MDGNSPPARSQETGLWEDSGSSGRMGGFWSDREARTEGSGRAWPTGQRPKWRRNKTRGQGESGTVRTRPATGPNGNVVISAPRALVSRHHVSRQAFLAVRATPFFPPCSISLMLCLTSPPRIPWTFHHYVKLGSRSVVLPLAPRGWVEELPVMTSAVEIVKDPAR